MLGSTRTEVAKVVHTIHAVAQRGSCLSAKLLLQTAEHEHLFSTATRRRLRSTVARCYSGRA